MCKGKIDWGQEFAFLSQLSLKKLIIKSAEPKDNVIKTSAKVTRRVTRHKRNHKTPGHSFGENPSIQIYLKGLEAFEISQSPDNYASNSQLEHLKKMGISKSHDDLRV